MARHSQRSSANQASNVWRYAFLLGLFAILFFQEIDDYLRSDDDSHLLRQLSAHRHANISAWATVPMGHRGGYGVVAVRDIAPGELLMKDSPLVRLKLAPVTVEQANQRLESLVTKQLSAEARGRLLSLSNAWQNHSSLPTPLNRYAGIFQTNGMSAGRGYMAIFPTIARLNHACTGAVNAVHSWRDSEKVQVVHASRLIKAGEEIFVSYFDSKRIKSDRQEYLFATFGFNCSCAMCSLDQDRATESDLRITRINSLKASLSAWSAGTMTGSEAVGLIEGAIESMREEGMSYEFGQLYADASHIATAHSDFQNARHYAKLAARHFEIELGPDCVEAFVARKMAKNPTSAAVGSSHVWATRTQETVR